MQNELSPEVQNRLIRLAWHDRTSFDAIRELTGLNEAEVIDVMRRELKPNSFKRWRARVQGRVTKHRRLLKNRLHRPQGRIFAAEDF